MSVYLTTQVANLRVAVENPQQQRISVRVIQDRNTVLFQDNIARNETVYRRLYNLESLPAGSYRLEATDGQRTVSRELVIQVAEPVPAASTRLVSLLN